MPNILPTEKRVAILRSLVEGNAIRATARIVGCSKNTVSKLLVDAGEACSRFQDEALRDLPCRQLQIDEIWAFVGMKQKTANRKGRGGDSTVGDAWTFTALDPETKLVPSFMVGCRDTTTATEFLRDLGSRLSNRVQLTTDGHSMYLEAVEDAFGAGVDYAMVIKQYGEDPEPQKRYSPARVLSVDKRRVEGRPDMDAASTSLVERQNLTMRMCMRRMTRLTNGFSKKVENLVHAVALHFMAYNFIKPHGTLTKRAGGIHTTPAMAAGVADRLWTFERVIDLLG